MAENKIYFRNRPAKLYNKMGTIVQTAKLLAVFLMSNQEFVEAKDFYNYDTENGSTDPGYHEYYIVLLFRKPDGELFTTVRSRHNPKAFGFNRNHKNKEEYYRGLIGQEFKIILQ